MKCSLIIITLFLFSNSTIQAQYVAFKGHRDTPPITACEEPPSVFVENPIPDSPGPDYFWVNGNWKWHGHWVWSKGKWVPKPYPEASWVSGNWEVKHQHWVWREGYWN